MDPCDSQMPFLNPQQVHGNGGGSDLTVNAQLRQPRLHSPSAATPWPRLADDEDEEVRYGATRPNMFEMGPLEDPAMEERRQRAIYAKRNREMKKSGECREVEKLQREVAVLRDISEQCQAKVTGMNHLVQSQESKIQELERSLADVRRQVKARDQQIRNTQERQRRMRTHLEMIAEGCEENNMARRMILTLLAIPSLTEEP